MTADWRATENAEEMSDWLPTRALTVATMNMGQNRGCGMAAK